MRNSLTDNNLDLVKLLPTVTNIISKVDFNKLKSVKVEKLKLLYKIKDSKLMLNISHEPENKEFNESFIEIVKLIFGSDDNVKFECHQVE